MNRGSIFLREAAEDGASLSTVADHEAEFTSQECGVLLHGEDSSSHPMTLVVPRGFDNRGITFQRSLQVSPEVDGRGGAAGESSGLL